MNEKPVLKCRTVTHTVVDYSDFDEFTKQVYGRSYEVAAAEEWSNDSQYERRATKGTLSSYDLEDLEFFKSGKVVSGILDVILTDLCNRDLLAEGKYLIKVCW